MNVENKVFLKINDKRYELISDSDSGIINCGRVIGNILIEKLNIDIMYKFNNLMKNNKIEIHETTSEKLTINNGLKSETNIKLTNEIYNKDNTSFHTIFKAVEKYLTKFFLERDKKLEKKRIEEAEIQEAKKYKLEQEKIEKEKKKKEAEEKELNRLAIIGAMCDKLFEVESFDQNYENRYSGNATLKIKPFIEGSSFQIYNAYCGEKTPQVQRNNNERARIQVGLSERGTIEFRW